LALNSSKSSDSLEWVDLIYRIAIKKLNNANNLSQDETTSALRSKCEETLARTDRLDTELWGWKLPETILVLPEVFAAFPSAKLIHLVRHPVDSSLRRTHMTSRMNNPIGAAVLNAAYRASERNIEQISADENYLHNAITWDYQVRQAIEYCRSSLASNQYLILHYEEFCAKPDRVISRIQAFLGTEVKRIDGLDIDLKRARSFDISDPRIPEVWNICQNTAEQLGYHEPIQNTDPNPKTDSSIL